MNENHRKLISYNIDKLILVTDFQTMINECLQKSVLTPVMVDIIEQDGKDELDKKRLLFQKLIHRGPTAFHILLEILQENDYKEAYDLLSVSTIPSATFTREQGKVDEYNSLSISMSRNRSQSKSPNLEPNINNGNKTDEFTIDGNIGSKVNKKPSKLIPYEEKTTFQFDASLKVRRAAYYGSHPKLQVYSMRSERRGVFFFVNIIKFDSGKDYRHGAEMDGMNLITRG